ncbi:hypothetical protein KI688_009104 [Linnemannia hyalina]|uniref:Uncharacterized protein n=1 Tax=Linnemannia hyalina TaxID=64524 RepID=A0A9P7Y1J0_9FUNG|nr:hypothetical protein KI688_009104 [Linnemannia hyalina]
MSEIQRREAFPNITATTTIQISEAGVLNILCVTTDPNAATFFGFAYADDYSTITTNPQLAVRVRSNTNPSSEGDFTWSVVSKLDGSKLNGYPDAVNGVDYSRAINAELVVTVFGRHAPHTSLYRHRGPLQDSIQSYRNNGARIHRPDKSAFYTLSAPSTSIILGPVVEFDADVIEMEYFVPIGPRSGASTFGLIKKYNDMFAFDNDDDLRYTHLIKDIKVSDTSTSNLYPVLPSDPPSEGQHYRQEASSGLLLERNKDIIAISILDKEKIASDEDNNSSISSKKIGDEGDGPTPLFLEGKYPDSSHRERRAPSYTDNLPMAPTTPVPERLQDQLKELQAEMQALQDRTSQTTQFSSHPRPNFVTTISYDRAPATATTTTPDPSEPQTRVLTTLKGP